MPPYKVFVGQGPCALPGEQGKNPPVTASPCQPPLGKGAIKDGVPVFGLDRLAQGSIIEAERALRQAVGPVSELYF